jgi:threonine dehydrogenase-like Zn-dependent dehydrogenase
MKALLHNGFTGYELTEIPLPIPEEHEICIAVKYCGISRSHLKKQYMKSGVAQDKPDGYEVSGLVFSLGSKVERLKIGDLVAVDLSVSETCCMRCPSCLEGNQNVCSQKNKNPGGGFAEYLVCKEHSAFILPDNFDLGLGALTEPLAVSLHAIEAVPRVSTAAVIGCGPIGLSLVTILHEKGLRRITAYAKYSHQAEVAKQLGAQNVSKFTKFLSPTIPTDVAFITSPLTSENVILAISIIKEKGTVCIIGDSEESIPVNFHSLLLKEKNIISSYCYTRSDFEKAVIFISHHGSSIKS